MAPEQARGRSDRVSPATDVYALGAILYEMLTGRPPFGGDDVLETLRQVTTQEPIPPRRLRPGLPRDLETICLKALTKEPAGRYASARELADDLGRFVRGESIRARPAGGLGRCWRWCKRNPGVAGLSTSLALALLGGVLGVAWQGWRAQQNADRAESQRLLAQQRLEEAEASLRQACQVVDDFFVRVSQEDLFLQPNVRPLRKKLLERALAHFQQLLHHHGDNPRLRFETAQAWLRVGDITAEIGPVATAESAYREAIAGVGALVELRPSDTGLLTFLSRCHMKRGFLMQRLDRSQQALQAYGQAASLLEQILLEQPGDVGTQLNLVACYGNMANQYVHLGQPAQALSWFDKVQARLQEVQRAQPDNKGLQRQMGRTLHNRAVQLNALRQLSEAIESLQQARSIRQRLLEADPRDPNLKRELAGTDGLLGDTYRLMGKATPIFAAS